MKIICYHIGTTKDDYKINSIVNFFDKDLREMSLRNPTEKHN